ncbi:MAG TPA: glycosyltransferase family 2 protein [Arcobacter sp.]|nr:glycosyltransferase family 2 protein [Arcobacter sp.]
MNELLFTIAIPTYNNEKTIKRAIDSALNQDTNVPYEILIVNNASDDNTADILNQYNDDKVRIITNEKTVSLFENHNICVKEGLGKYIIYCHSDDYLLGHVLKIYESKLAKRLFPNKYVVWGHSMFRDYSSTFIQQGGISYNEMSIGMYSPLPLLYSGLTPSGTCYSRKTLLAMGGFLDVFGTAPSDMSTMIYLAMNGFGFEMIDEMVFIREDASTAPKAGEEDKYLQSLDYAFEPFIETVNREEVNYLILLSRILKNKPYHFYYALAQDEGYKNEIKKYLPKQIMRHPWHLKSSFVRKLIKRLYS